MNSPTIYLDLERDYDDDGTWVYEARFKNNEEILDDSASTNLYKSLSIILYHQRDKDPIEAIQKLRDVVFKSLVEDYGIKSCPLIEDLNQLASNKITSLKNARSVCLDISQQGASYSAHAEVNDDTCYSFVNGLVLNSKIGSINGLGQTKKEAAEDYIMNLELYEDIIHTFIQRVKELSKEEFPDLKIRGE